MNTTINSIFKKFIGRNIYVYTKKPIYDNYDVKVATAIIYLLDREGYTIEDCNFMRLKDLGIVSQEVCDDIEWEKKHPRDEDPVSWNTNFLSYVDKVKACTKSNLGDTLISAANYNFFVSVLGFKDNCDRSSQYYRYFNKERPVKSYEVGKKFWQRMKEYDEKKALEDSQNKEQPQDEAQPE